MNRLKYLKDYKLVLSLLFVIVIMLFILNEVAGFLGLVLAVGILYEIAFRREEIESNEVNNIEKLCENFDSAAQDSLFNMPFPLILTNNKGIITWYNPAFLKIIDQNQAVGDEIEDVLDGFYFEEIIKSDDDIELEIDNKNYIVYLNRVKKTDGNVIYLFYFAHTYD